MKRLAILLLLVPSIASAQSGFIARPADEDCSLSSIAPDGTVTVNWPCVEVYAAKKDWQVADWHRQALVMKAIHEGRAK